MNERKLLLLSNSTNASGEFLADYEEKVRDFIPAEIRNIIFIPYAAVSFSFDDYTNKVASYFLEKFSIKVESIHNIKNKERSILNSDVIVVGGGNTFALVSRCYENQIMNPIRYRISKGGHYIGWSAGSNLACPSIKTTNDMPIVEPYSFNALGLIPFQINPHYTSKTIDGHGGESRDDRIEEFIQMNPKSYVIGLPEGNCIEIRGDEISMFGNIEASIFKSGQNKSSVRSGEDLSFLMQK